MRGEFRANAQTNSCCGLARLGTRRVRCAWGRAQASEPTLTASGLAAIRRVKCARADPFRCFAFLHVSDWLLLYVVCEYVPPERYAPNALLLVSGFEPGPADSSLSKERRAGRDGGEATSLSRYPTHRSFCGFSLAWTTHWIEEPCIPFLSDGPRGRLSGQILTA